MIVQNGRRKLHYLYPDQTELIEELDMNSNEVMLRKWKRPKDKEMPAQQVVEWEYEIGEEPKAFNPETDTRLRDTKKNTNEIPNVAVANDSALYTRL